jgi:hypothetical protein
MPSYETLDAIADAYTPFLLAASLAMVLVAAIKAEWRLAGRRLLAVIGMLAIAYGLMFLDRRFDLWPAFGLDYSTHTAVTVGLVAFLAVDKPRFAAVWATSLVAYFLLMLYQRYHTGADIATTAIVVAVPSWLMLAWLYHRRPFTRRAPPR